MDFSNAASKTLSIVVCKKNSKHWPSFARLLPQSVAILKPIEADGCEMYAIYFEGNKHGWTPPHGKSEQDEKAVIAAGRARDNYPTIARFFLPDTEGLDTIGHVNLTTWEVIWDVGLKVEKEGPMRVSPSEKLSYTLAEALREVHKTNPRAACSLACGIFRGLHGKLEEDEETLAACKEFAPFYCATEPERK